MTWRSSPGMTPQQIELENSIRRTSGTGKCLESRKPCFFFGGNFHGNSSIYNWMNRWCKAHQIRFHGLHASRHFAATQMIGSGIDVRTVSAVLDHAKPFTTLNIYSHEIDQLKTAAVDVIAGAIENNKDQTKTKAAETKKESTENSA